MTTEKVHFTKEKETMLITLYSRALESRTEDPVLRDPWAEEAIRRIDYDFAHLKLAKIAPLSTAIRAKQFDLWTTLLAQRTMALIGILAIATPLAFRPLRRERSASRRCACGSRKE